MAPRLACGTPPLIESCYSGRVDWPGGSGSHGQGCEMGGWPQTEAAQHRLRSCWMFKGTVCQCHTKTALKNSEMVWNGSTVLISVRSFEWNIVYTFFLGRDLHCHSYLQKGWSEVKVPASKMLKMECFQFICELGASGDLDDRGKHPTFHHHAGTYWPNFQFWVECSFNWQFVFPLTSTNKPVILQCCAWPYSSLSS